MYSNKFCQTVTNKDRRAISNLTLYYPKCVAFMPPEQKLLRTRCKQKENIPLEGALLKMAISLFFNMHLMKGEKGTTGLNSDKHLVMCMFLPFLLLL